MSKTKVDPAKLGEFASAVDVLKEHSVVTSTPVGPQIKTHLDAAARIARGEYDKVKEKNEDKPTSVRN